MSAEAIGLILRLARGDHAALAHARGVVPTSALVEQAIAGGLAVVLLRGLATDPAHLALPPAALDALERRQGRQRQRSAMLLEALEGVAGTFASAGLPFMLLKGPYHAQRLYGDVAGREFVDLDVLVPSTDRLRATRALEQSGYTRRSRMVAGPAVTSLFVHGFDFRCGDARLDLHWCLSRHPSIQVDEARLWAAKSTYSVGGREYAVLSDEHDVVFGALSLLRDIERGRSKAKNVVDLIQIAAAAEAALDWDAVFARARDEGTLGPLVNVLSLCFEVAEAHDLAPRLATALEAHAPRAPKAAGVPFSFPPALWGLGNRWWAARAHDSSLATWLLWWAASLPFRVAVHGRPRARGTTSRS